MKDSRQLPGPAGQEIAHSRKTSATTAGQVDKHDRDTRLALSAELVDAINQVFALFRINYHNQYHAAFGDTQLLTQAKRLWAETLCDFAPPTILRGAKRAIEESEYLPTLHRMIGFCRGPIERLGLPDVHSAYLEACRAPSPKADHDWSHAAVYHAGRRCDWYFLANNPEAITFPVFKRHYTDLCQTVLNGEELSAPSRQKLERESVRPLPAAENQRRLSELRKKLSI